MTSYYCARNSPSIPTTTAGKEARMVPTVQYTTDVPECRHCEGFGYQVEYGTTSNPYAMEPPEIHHPCECDERREDEHGRPERDPYAGEARCDCCKGRCETRNPARAALGEGFLLYTFPGAAEDGGDLIAYSLECAMELMGELDADEWDRARKAVAA